VSGTARPRVEHARGLEPILARYADRGRLGDRTPWEQYRLLTTVRTVTSTVMSDLRLASSAFADGEAIPDRFGYRRENVNPPLTIDGVPDEAAALALIVDDPDAVEPAGKVWDHWVVWNIPSDTESIPEDWDAAAAGAVEGRTDYGERGYGGPNPPDREHSYRFRLSALDDRVDLDSGATSDDLRAAMEGHVLAEAELTGSYAPG